MNATTSRTTQRPLQRPGWRRLQEKWEALQVGRQGSYSIERLESLDYYCRTTSRTRVLLVRVLTPLPSLLVIILLECLPLRPPSEGLAANWVFWIRLGCTVLTMTFAAMVNLYTFVPDLNATLENTCYFCRSKRCLRYHSSSSSNNCWFSDTAPMDSRRVRHVHLSSRDDAANVWFCTIRS